MNRGNIGNANETPTEPVAVGPAEDSSIGVVALKVFGQAWAKAVVMVQVLTAHETGSETPISCK